MADRSTSTAAPAKRFFPYHAQTIAHSEAFFSVWCWVKHFYNISCLHSKSFSTELNSNHSMCGMVCGWCHCDYRSASNVYDYVNCEHCYCSGFGSSSSDAQPNVRKKNVWEAICIAGWCLVDFIFQFVSDFFPILLRCDSINIKRRRPWMR